MHLEFLMVGRRWDTNITEPLPFERPQWESHLRGVVSQHGRRRAAEWIDYLAFSRGPYGPDMPPFVLRVFWDNGWRGKHWIRASRWSMLGGR